MRYWREMGVHHGRGSRDGLPAVRLPLTMGSVKIISVGGSAAALLEWH